MIFVLYNVNVGQILQTAKGKLLKDFEHFTYKRNTIIIALSLKICVIRG
jgi:hypothetical protein